MEELSMLQRILLYGIYALFILMILFSILALGNGGQQGYQKCVQQKCELRGQDYCSKPRELASCCEGAGGQLALRAEGYGCVFG